MSWRLSPWGWILTLALLVLVLLAIFAPSTGVFVGLAVVILIWAGLLSSSFPSTRSMYNHTLYTASFGQEDFGEAAATEHEHDRGHLD
jgi:hypothetical protein